jgi:catechol-2,3-dioxygenase
MADGTVETTAKPRLKLEFLSHGTLECRDLEKTRQFYEEFLGLEVIRTGKVSLMIRLNSANTIAVVYNPNKKPSAMLSHNGLDAASRDEVDRSYETIMAEKDQWGIQKVTRPMEQHGSYSFYFSDLDENWWEILANPEGGYSWMFAKGGDLKNYGAGEGDGGNPNSFSGKKSRAGH